MNLELVKKLRGMTGAGILDCKDALQKSDGDLTEAVTILRKEGIAKSSKKSDRVVKEGCIVSLLSDDLKKGVLIEINCETDFVARNEVFLTLTQDIAKILLNDSGSSFDEGGFLKESSLKEKAVKCIQESVVTLGENLKLSRACCFETKGILSSYVHLGGKIGVLLDINPSDNCDVKIFKDISMHIVASHPIYLRREEVPEEILKREKDIVLEQNKDKASQFLDKIVSGKMKKYFSEVCLLEQSFVKDPSQDITKILKGSKIDRFVRFELAH